VFKLFKKKEGTKIMPLTKDELKSYTPEQLAELETILQEYKTVLVSQEKQPEAVVEPSVDVVEEIIEEVVEETVIEPVVEETVKVVEEPKPTVDLDQKFGEIEKKFDDKIIEILKSFDDKSKALESKISSLEKENAELKRTSPFGGFTPKPSEGKLTKDVENRDSLVEQYRKGYKNQK
jgi:hypothetical protein